MGHRVCAALRGIEDRLRAKPRTEAPLDPQYYHSWRQRGCLWQCTRCLLAAEAPLLERCPLHPARRFVLETLGKFVSVQGHRLWSSLGYTWCSACAAHTRTRMQHLSSVCPGKPRNQSACTILNRLASGLRPFDRKGTPPRRVPERLTLQQWMELRGFVQPADGEICDDVPLLHYRNAMEQSDFIFLDNGEELSAATTASLGSCELAVAVADAPGGVSDSD